MIVAAETAVAWMPNGIHITGQSLEHASVHAHFWLQPAISIEYYLPGPSWRLTVTHRCPRTDTLIAVPPMSSAVRSTTDMMIGPAAEQKQNNELSAHLETKEDDSRNSKSHKRRCLVSVNTSSWCSKMFQMTSASLRYYTLKQKHKDVRPVYTFWI